MELCTRRLRICTDLELRDGWLYPQRKIGTVSILNLIESKTEDEAFAIRLLDSNEQIGEFHFHHQSVEERWIEIAYMIFEENKELRHHGYMTEAVQVILPWLFSIMKLDKITALCERANTPSLKILQRFGFVWTRRDDKYYEYDWYECDQSSLNNALSK